MGDVSALAFVGGEVSAGEVGFAGICKSWAKGSSEGDATASVVAESAATSMGSLLSASSVSS